MKNISVIGKRVFLNDRFDTFNEHYITEQGLLCDLSQKKSCNFNGFMSVEIQKSCNFNGFMSVEIQK